MRGGGGGGGGGEAREIWSRVMTSGRQMVDTQSAEPTVINLFCIDLSTNGIDRLPCERSDIQPLDGQYKTGHSSLGTALRVSTICM